MTTAATRGATPEPGPRAWGFDRATMSATAAPTFHSTLNPIQEENGPAETTAIEVSNRFPVEQVLTRTVIVHRSPKNPSPKRTAAKGGAKSGAGVGAASPTKAPSTSAATYASPGSRSSGRRSKPPPCPTVGCRLGKKLPRAGAKSRSTHAAGGAINDQEMERARFDRCAGVETALRPRDFKRTVFSKIADESFKVRRVRRPKAKPAPSKAKVKTTKAAQLRFKYIRNQDVSSSVTEAHMKKYRKPPFKTVGVLRLCYEKLSEKLEKLKIRKPRSVSKSPGAKKKKARSKKK